MTRPPWSFGFNCEQRAYFLKLRKGRPNLASLTIPHHLRKNGIDSVVAPVLTTSGELFAELGVFSLILYPWIAGESKWGKTLSLWQWRAWGAITRAIHKTEISEVLKSAFASGTIRRALDEQTGKC